MKKFRKIFNFISYIILVSLPVIFVTVSLKLFKIQEQYLEQAISSERRTKTVYALKDLSERNLISALLQSKIGNNNSDAKYYLANLIISVQKLRTNNEYESEIVKSFYDRLNNLHTQYSIPGNQNTFIYKEILGLIRILDSEQAKYSNEFLANLTSSLSKRKYIIWIFQILNFLMAGFFIYLMWLRISKINSEIKLSENEKLYDVMFNSLDEGVFVIEPDGNIRHCNTSAYKILGVRKSDLISSNLQKVFGKIRLENGSTNIFSQSLIKKLFSEPIRNFIFKLNDTEKNTKWLSISTDALPLALGSTTKLLILTFIDVTKEMEHRITIEEQKSMLTNAERLSTLGTVAANIAHEIGNPLTVIRGNADILKRLSASNSPTDQENAKKRADVILKSIDHVSKIISGVSRLSRGGDKDPYAYIFLPKLIEETLVFTADKFRKSNVKLEVCSIPEIEIECREIQISQVILNLVTNACDAAENTDGKWVKVEAFEEDKNQISILITDSGTGISPEVLQKIFQPFFTTKQIGKGTGLGLPISKQIIADHNGQLFIQTSKEGNTQFIVKLPKTQSVQN